MKQYPFKNAAFSLLELIAVVAILGLIASLILPRVSTSTTKAKQKTCFHHRAQINTAVEMYYLENSEFPAALSDIDTPDAFPDGIPTCPVSGVAYLLNATTHRVQGHLGGGKSGGHP
jgi:prepilin-type N-terminal cleavage/methylation domain-containing protein